MRAQLFYRRREKVISESLKRLREQKAPTAFPVLLRNYPEYESLKKQAEEFNKCNAALISMAEKDAQEETLHADGIIKALFGKATKLVTTDAYFELAKRRITLGNPPGKPNSYGDAINWESLLNHTYSDELVLIASDGDYYSHLDRNQLSGFLRNEWKNRQPGELVTYKTLSAFFRARYPTITLSADLQKTFAIQELEESGSFAATHQAIATLTQCPPFSPAEIRRLLQAGLANDQIWQIAGDEDVKRFFTGLMANSQMDVCDNLYVNAFLAFIETDEPVLFEIDDPHEDEDEEPNGENQYEDHGGYGHEFTQEEIDYYESEFEERPDAF